MAASLDDIKRWVNSAKERNCTHLIVVCDSCDFDDYPVYVSKDEDINERIEYYRKAEMQRIMEIYNMSMDLDSQLKDHRAYNV